MLALRELIILLSFVSVDIGVGGVSVSLRSHLSSHECKVNFRGIVEGPSVTVILGDCH